MFSISFPGDETIYLQAGTDDLVGEWVATCNYWSARKSRQPLQGGVSNMEYGWQRVLPTNEPDPHRRSHSNNDDDRMSVRSGKSNMSKMGTYSRRPIGSNPADKMHVNDWKPPAPSLMPSPLDEENQLEALVAYVQQVKEELKAHKELEEPMKQQASSDQVTCTTTLMSCSAVLPRLEELHESNAEFYAERIIPGQGDLSLRGIHRYPPVGHCAEIEETGREKVGKEFG